MRSMKRPSSGRASSGSWKSTTCSIAPNCWPASCSPKSDRLAIVTNAGGPGVMTTDALIARGGQLAALAAETIEELNQFLPDCWSHGNPVDIVGDAPPERFSRALETVLKDKNVDAVLVILTPQAMTDATATARAVGQGGGPAPASPSWRHGWAAAWSARASRCSRAGRAHLQDAGKGRAGLPAPRLLRPKPDDPARNAARPAAGVRAGSPPAADGLPGPCWPKAGTCFPKVFPRPCWSPTRSP